MKRKRLVRKEYLILAIAIVLFFVIIIGLWGQFFDNELQKCIEEKQKKFPSNNETIMRGHIIVHFKENVTESEASSLIHRHGLDMKGLMGSFIVYVPDGDEYGWLCILEDSEIVEYAAINYNTKG